MEGSGELTLSRYQKFVFLLKKNDPKDEKSEEKNARERIDKTPLHIDGTESWVFLEFCKKFNCSLLISLGKLQEFSQFSPKTDCKTS